MNQAKSIRPEEQLISAVIALAIEDACLPPIRKPSKQYAMNQHAYTAFRFLFEHGDYYLQLVNIDPKSFRERLVKQLTDLTHNRPFDISSRPNIIAERRKRMVRVNQKLYAQGIVMEMPTEEDEYL